MLLHAFLNGLGIALAYTTITSMIVEAHVVHDLPQIYIVTGVLLLFSGFIYSKLEHKFQPSRLFAAVLLFLSLWGILMFLSIGTTGNQFLILAIAFSSYYLIYYLSNLEYWGSASLLFNVREGKRLFGLLSVGESIAKITGYVITPVIISSFNVQGVFIIVALSFFLAFLIFKTLSGQYQSTMALSHDHNHHDEKSGTIITQLSLKKIFTQNKFKTFISLFALISSLSLFLIHYAFLVRVEEHFYDLNNIAVFIASLLSIAKFLNLSIKVFLSSRMFQTFGLRAMLLFLPITLCIVTLIGVFGIVTGQTSESYIIIVFSIIFLLDEVLRTSLYTPAYLTLFQPLTKAKRLEGHTLSKGIMEPIGIAIAGVVLYTLVESGVFNLEAVSYIILFWLVIWIIAGTQLYKAYLGILKNALKTKLLNRGTLNLSKDEVKLLKEVKLKSSDPNAQLYALQMLGDRLRNSERKDVIINLLQAEDPFILKTAIKYVHKHRINGLESALADHLAHDNTDVTKAAIHAYCDLKKAECIPYFLEIIDSVDIERQDTIVAGAIKYGGLAGAIEFGRRLLDMLKDEDPGKRIRAAYIIGEIRNKNYYLPLMDLLRDKDLEVRKAAVIASGKVKNPALVPALLKAGKKRRLFLEAKQSLGKFGDGVTKSLHAIIHKKGPARDITYIKLLSLNDHVSVTDFYVSMLESANFDVRRATINALFQRSFKCDEKNTKLTNQLINDLVNSCNQLLKDYNLISKPESLELVYNELFNIQILLLYQCLSFKYQKRAIQDIIDNTYRTEKEYKTIALELLENTLSPRDGRKVIPIIEKTYDLDFARQANFANDTSADFFHRIIIDANHNFSSWITANAIRYHRINRVRTSVPVDLTASDIILINQESNAFASI